MSTRRRLPHVAAALALTGALVLGACGDDDGAGVRNIGEEDGGTGTGTGTGTGSPTGTGTGTGSPTGTGTGSAPADG